MTPEPREIEALVARAADLAASIPEGDFRRILVPTMTALCDGISLYLRFHEAGLQGQLRGNYSAQLAFMGEQLRHLLWTMEALDLGGELAQPSKGRRGSRPKASKPL